MTVLVTGGAGYIGSHMVHRLCDAGETVVVLDNLTTGFDWALPAAAQLIQGDVGDEELVCQIIREHGVGAIVHFAGSIVVPESVADPLGYYLNNTVKSRTLIAAAVAENVKHFIFSSTAAVYGAPETMPVTETTPQLPVSPYGSSKLMTETMLRDTAFAHDFRYVALRYFNVAGADPQGRTGQSTKGATHLIKVACEAAKGKRSHMDVFGTDYDTADGTCVRDYIHVSDLVKAHSDALAYLRDGGDAIIMNCGYSRGFSVLEVLDSVKRVSGVDFEVRLSDRRPGDPPQIVAASDLVRSTLNWQPDHEDLDTIVRHALDWEAALAKRNR
ncbi:MAG: UDP-glucose 4-epimerase [Hyphomicrobiaceae bacterium]|jgi:UDP-glucose 4-epimerase